MTQDEAKRLVAKRAVEFVEDGMAVGLGTGTTARSANIKKWIRRGGGPGGGHRSLALWA